MNLKQAMRQGGNLRPPRCAAEGCDNKAFILTAGQFVCGDCANKFQEYVQKRLNEILSKLNDNVKPHEHEDNK